MELLNNPNQLNHTKNFKLKENLQKNEKNQFLE